MPNPPATDEVFLSLNDALDRLEEALQQPLSNPLAIDGTILRFEFTFELFWKWMKKLLLAKEGIDVASPKQVLQKAYALKWIDNETSWLEMLNDRNLTSNTYKEETAKSIYDSIQSHYPLLRETFIKLTDCYYK